MNPINKKDNKCFQYAVTVALNLEEIRKDLERIIKIKHYDWKDFKKNNVTFALNVLYAKKEKNISCICFKT